MEKFGKNAVLESFFLKKILWTPRRHFLQPYWKFCAQSPSFFAAKAENTLKEIFFFKDFINSLRTTIWTHEMQFLQPRWKTLVRSTEKFAQSEIDK